MRLSQQTNKPVLYRLFQVFALMLIMGAFFMTGTTVYASEPELSAAIDTAPEQLDETAAAQGEALLIVKEVWLTGDMLNISVTDSVGEDQTLELNLRDYAKPGDEYVTVQATDSAGNTSNSIQFKNPYYTANAEPPSEDGENPSGGEPAEADDENPFTPDGSGTVIDDTTEGDGKEFFTVDTADGNTFYLIVDRQRGGDNVYLLDAVSEEDLASLAKPGDGKSPITATTPITTPTPEPSETSPQTTPEPTTEKSGVNTGTIALVVVVILAVGGIGYYIKIVRPKKNGTDGYADDGFDDDTEADLGDGEDGEDE